MENYRVITKLPDLQKYLCGCPVVAFDIETAPDVDYRDEDKAALDPHKSHITGISFCASEGNAVYVPIAHKNSENIQDTDEFWAFLKKEFFGNKNVVKVAHNLSFEAAFMYGMGIIIQSPCYDTIAAAQLTLNSQWKFRKLKDSGLKLLATSLFKVEMPSFKDLTNGRHFDEMDPTAWETVRYACADSDYALRLYYKINQWFDENLPQHRVIVEQLESPTAVYCGMMRYNGVPIDINLMTTRQVEADSKIAEIRAELDHITGGVDIGANASTTVFKKYLFEDLALPVLKKTEKGQAALDDMAIQLLKEWADKNQKDLVHLFDLVQEYRKLAKLKSTYIDGYLSCVNVESGRIHPDLLPMGTDTGRFASRNPNMQNCPRKTNDPVGVRSFICASPGNVLMSLDFSQIELRVGAFFCRDEKMLETYRNGGDIHAQTTAVIFGISFQEAINKENTEYKERRTIAKNCNFGVFFGLFPKGLQQTLKFKAGLDVSLSRCGEIISNLKSGYPRLAVWQEETIATARILCYAETWLGRRRYLPGMLSENWGIRSGAERCALNSPIQGTAADILKAACARIVEGMPERMWLHPILQVHDELVFELPAEKLEEAVAFVKSCMEQQPYPEFDVPIVAEASAGPRFGEMKELNIDTACGEH